MSFTIQNEIDYMLFMIESNPDSPQEDKDYLEALKKFQQDLEGTLAENERIIQQIKDTRTINKRQRTAVLTNAALKMKAENMHLNATEIDRMVKNDPPPILRDTKVMGIRGIFNQEEYSFLRTRGRATTAHVSHVKSFFERNKFTKDLLPFPVLMGKTLESVMPIGFIQNTKGSKIRSRLDLVVLSEPLSQLDEQGNHLVNLTTLLVINPCLWTPRSLSFDGVSPKIPRLKDKHCPVPYVSRNILFDGDPWTPMSMINLSELEDEWQQLLKDDVNHTHKDHPFNLQNLQKLIRSPEWFLVIRNQSIDFDAITDFENNASQPDVFHFLKEAASIWGNLLKQRDEVDIEKILFGKETTGSRKSFGIPNERLQEWNDYNIKSKNTSKEIKDTLRKSRGTSEASSNENHSVYDSELFYQERIRLTQAGIMTKVVPLSDGIPFPEQHKEQMTLGLLSHFGFNNIIAKLVEYYDAIKFHYHKERPSEEQNWLTQAEKAICTWLPTLENATCLTRIRWRINSENDVQDFFANGCWIQWDTIGPFFDFFLFCPPETIWQTKIELVQSMLGELADKCAPYIEKEYHNSSSVDLSKSEKMFIDLLNGFAP